MSCVNSEVIKSYTEASIKITLTREWLKWNDASDCVFMLRDSRKNYAQRFLYQGEAENAFTSSMSDGE